MRKSLLSLLSVAAIVSAGAAVAQEDTRGHGRRSTNPNNHRAQAGQSVDTMIGAHPELKKYIDHYGWRRAVRPEGDDCSKQGELLPRQRNMVLRCFDYRATDGSLWRVQLNYQDNNKVGNVFLVEPNGKLVTKLVVENDTVIVDNTGLSQPAGNSAGTPSVAQQSVDPDQAAKDAVKNLLGNLLKKGK